MNQPTSIKTPRSNDGTWVIAVGAIVASLGAYVFQVVGGRTLGTDGFAPVATVWTIGFLVYTIVMLPVEQMTTRTVTLRAGEALDAETRRQIAITLIGGAILGVVVAALGVETFFAGSAAFIAPIALLLLSRALMTVARGVMAGRRRFMAYGVTMILEAVALISLGVVFSIIDVGSFWFAISLGAAPLTLLLVRPYKVHIEPGRIATEVPKTTGLLQLLVVASALSQLILAGGPLIVGLIGGTPAEVSIYFMTFTLLRGPITASYPLGTRFLAAMTTALSEDKPEVLHTWAARLAGLGGAAALVSGVTAYVILPPIVELLYGAEFRPSAIVGGLGGAGAVAAPRRPLRHPDRLCPRSNPGPRRRVGHRSSGRLGRARDLRRRPAHQSCIRVCGGRADRTRGHLAHRLQGLFRLDQAWRAPTKATPYPGELTGALRIQPLPGTGCTVAL